MKVMNWFIKLITLGWASAITLSPFAIYFKKKEYFYRPVLVNHEMIHWYQQIEMFVIFFYIWYGLEYIIRFIIWIFTFFSQKWMPYKNLSMEREANHYECDFLYFEKRQKYAWMKFIFKK
jgi:hypothetical protein